ncbi:hypothetical protein BaRGS_00009535 [Batillaria attramentaria]|uniref:Uncharacterized protein n=1 Tax=Batillaria attramentaria TaxID=370345 RepID=A0ABD0LIS3_9CAEN
MALKPVLKIKVDELFLRWLSEPETQQILRENLHQIAHGEAITQPSPRSGYMHKPSSPRPRPGSPTLSTSASKLPSPRSPRRPLGSKNNHKNAFSSSSDSKVVSSVADDGRCPGKAAGSGRQDSMLLSTEQGHGDRTESVAGELGNEAAFSSRNCYT